MFTKIIFLLVYFQIGLGNAIGCEMLKVHKGTTIYKTFCFIFNSIFWPLCVGLELAKKVGK